MAIPSAASARSTRMKQKWSAVSSASLPPASAHVPNNIAPTPPTSSLVEQIVATVGGVIFVANGVGERHPGNPTGVVRLLRSPISELGPVHSQVGALHALKHFEHGHVGQRLAWKHETVRL